MKRMGMRFMAFLLTAAMAFPAVSVSGANRLTIDEAIRIAVGSSKKRKELLVDRRKKEVELKGAKQAVSDYLSGRFLIKFSLLFNLSITDQYEGMPKEIDMAMAIPELQTEIANNRAEVTYTSRKDKNSAELQFYDIMLSDYTIDFTEKMIADKKITFEVLQNQLNTGASIDPADVDYVRKEIEALEKGLNKERLQNLQKRDKLGKILNMEIRSNYTLDARLPSVSIDRGQLPRILKHAEDNDFTLNKVIANRKIAERNVEELMGMYASQFGRFVADVNRYIRTHKGNMDYDQFTQMYDYSLYMDDSPWYGAWTINLLFFKIHIPKDWFKGKWDGTRYLKDKKYELFVGVVEMNKLMEMEDQARDELHATINDLYNTLKEQESVCKETTTNIKLAEEAYAQILRDNQLGIATFSSVESEKTNMKNMQKSLYEANIEYAKALSTFDFYTSGYVSTLALGQSSNISSDYASGSSFMTGEEEEAVSQPTWVVEQTLTDYRFAFYVKLTPEVKATHFELFTEDNQLIGNRTGVGEPLFNLPITYSETPILHLKLYNEGRLAYTATLEGTKFSGPLILIPVDQNTVQIPVGTYVVEEPTAMTGEIAISITDGTDFDVFELHGNGYLVGQSESGGKIIHLATSFSDVGNLEIVLKKGEAEVKRLKLQGTKSQGDLIQEAPR